MRLWHYKLIPVLPRQQLLGQWRECCLIAKQISEFGTPNHVLVNRVMNYPINEFTSYGIMIANEMIDRGYSVDQSKFTKYFCEDIFPFEGHLFNGWHDNKYLYQCLMNLQEKHDCGAIPDFEWEQITNKYPNMK